MDKTAIIENIKLEYALTDDTEILVTSNWIYSHYAMLGRHVEGNEERLQKLRQLIDGGVQKNKFTNHYTMSFQELMDLYDVSNPIDKKNVQEILQNFKNIKKERVNDIQKTCQMEPIQAPTDDMEEGYCLHIGSGVYPLKSGMNYIIGRQHNNTIMLDDATVSRRHCRLSVNEDEIRLEDIGSQNGTYVNGERIKNTLLKLGDKIRIGAICGYLA